MARRGPRRGADRTGVLVVRRRKMAKCARNSEVKAEVSAVRGQRQPVPDRQLPEGNVLQVAPRKTCFTAGDKLSCEECGHPLHAREFFSWEGRQKLCAVCAGRAGATVLVGKMADVYQSSVGLGPNACFPCANVKFCGYACPTCRTTYRCEMCGRRCQEKDLAWVDTGTDQGPRSGQWRCWVCRGEAEPELSRTRGPLEDESEVADLREELRSTTDYIDEHATSLLLHAQIMRERCAERLAARTAKDAG